MMNSFAKALDDLIAAYPGLTAEAKIATIEQALEGLKLDQIQADQHAKDQSYGAQLMGLT